MISLPVAALDPVSEGGDNPIGPYGFGYLRIPQADINRGMIRDGYFVLKWKTDPNVSLVPITTVPNAFKSDAPIEVFRDSEGVALLFKVNGNPEIVDAAGNTINKVSVVNDGYLGIINNSPESTSFAVVKTEEVCDTTKSSNPEIWSPVYKACLSCSSGKFHTDPANKLHVPDGTCDLAPDPTINWSSIKEFHDSTVDLSGRGCYTGSATVPICSQQFECTNSSYSGGLASQSHQWVCARNEEGNMVYKYLGIGIIEAFCPSAVPDGDIARLDFNCE